MQEAFSADPRTVDAVITKLEITGEAANGIPEDQKLQRPDIDWRAIRGLRNRIVPESFGLSLAVIWAITCRSWRRGSVSGQEKPEMHGGQGDRP
jgi:uncharacterized protein with HEPN domain